MNGTAYAVGRIAGKNGVGTDVQRLAVRQVDSGLVGVGGGVVQYLRTVAESDFSTCRYDAVSGGIAGDQAIFPDGDVVVSRQRGIFLNRSILAEGNAAFDGIQHFGSTFYGTPGVVRIVVNGFGQVSRICLNGGSVQNGVISQGDLSAVGFDRDGSRSRFTKHDASGNAVVHGLRDGFARLGIGSVKSFRRYGTDSRVGGHVSVQRNLGIRVAGDLSGCRDGTLQGHIVTQLYGYFIGVLIRGRSRFRIGLACGRSRRILRSGGYAFYRDGLINGNVVADVHLAVRGFDGRAENLGSPGVFRSHDGNVPAVNGGVRGVGDNDFIGAVRRFAQRNVVEFDLFVDQVVIEIDQFAACISHLDGDASRTGDGRQLGLLFLGQRNVV